MKLAEIIKYLVYFVSYFLVYLVSYPTLIIVGFATEDPTISQSTIDLVFYSFATIVTILGVVGLNIIFKRFLSLEKNNKYSWLIILSHLVLIPLTYALII